MNSLIATKNKKKLYTGLTFWTRGQSTAFKGMQFQKEEEVSPDQFTIDVLKFFFEEELLKEQLNDELKEVAANALWKATEASKAIDLIPRPPGGKPSFIWLISQVVQIAFRKAQNKGIYETVRKTIKWSMRSEYILARDKIFSQSKITNAFLNNLNISEQAVNLIKQFEGFKSNLYNDPGGHCTIGYGTLVHKGNCNESESDEFKKGITQERALQLLKNEAAKYERTINNNVTIPLNQNQFDALVSFVYNIGPGAFANSTLLKKLNNGDYNSVPFELKKWVNSGGKKLPGLVKRREMEAELFSTGSYSFNKSVMGLASIVGLDNLIMSIDWTRIDFDSRILYVMKLLVDRYCYPVNGAAGITGNLISESGVLPNRIEGSSSSSPMTARNFQGQVANFTAEEIMNRNKAQQIGPKLPGVGLAQWTSSGRRAGLFTHSYGNAPSGSENLFNMDVQIDYLVNELKTSYTGVNSIISNQNVSVNDASDEFVYNFEIPGSVLDSNNSKLPRSDSGVQSTFKNRRANSQKALKVYQDNP